jgi:hypothetical protein
MKVVHLVGLMLLAGCSTNEPSIQDAVKQEYAEIDSIIQISQEHVLVNDSINKVSEKIITQKIEQTVEKIETLKEEVAEARLTANKVITKTDTIYIETKKNFWGKAKTTTSVKSDSTVEEVIDTLNNQNQFRL